MQYNTSIVYTNVLNKPKYFKFAAKKPFSNPQVSKRYYACKLTFEHPYTSIDMHSLYKTIKLKKTRRL